MIDKIIPAPLGLTPRTMMDRDARRCAAPATGNSWSAAGADGDGRESSPSFIRAPGRLGPPYQAPPQQRQRNRQCEHSPELAPPASSLLAKSLSIAMTTTRPDSALQPIRSPGSGHRL